MINKKSNIQPQNIKTRKFLMVVHIKEFVVSSLTKAYSITLLLKIQMQSYFEITLPPELGVFHVYYRKKMFLIVLF